MNFKRNFPLAEICSLNIKEIASYYCEILDFEDIEEIRSFISRKNIPFLLLGEGTNIVPTDTFKGLVIQNQIKGIELLDSFTIKVSSGENWHDFVEWTVLHDLSSWGCFMLWLLLLLTAVILLLIMICVR